MVEGVESLEDRWKSFSECSLERRDGEIYSESSIERVVKIERVV